MTGLVDSANVLVVVEVEGVELSPTARTSLVRAVVDTSLQLPAMFELFFQDVSGQPLTQAGLRIGAKVAIRSGAQGSVKLIEGEVTAIEGLYDEGLTGQTVVRGYDRTHRLQRVRRTRAFLNSSDSDIASRVASDAGLTVGEITPTDVVHDHVTQYDQTDWDFLRGRAAEIGYEFGMKDGGFVFRKASSVSSMDDLPYQLTLHQNLTRFSPRLTAGNLAPEVEVRVWDPQRSKVVSSRTSVASAAASGDSDPNRLADTFQGSSLGASGGSTSGEQYGPAPSSSAYVLMNRPVGGGASADSAVTQTAKGLSDHLGSTFAEGEGDAVGSSQIQAGKVVSIDSLPSQFPGQWVVTRARHIFAYADGGYHTEFTVGGRRDHSLAGLAALSAGQASTPRVPGVVCAIVSNINGTTGRVKVTLPWLSPDYESNWAPVVQFGAGPRSGGLFMPEVGDQVLVGFEHGDPRRPYVLGGVPNEKTTYTLGGDAVQASGAAGAVVRRGFVSSSGNLLSFHDEMPPGEGGGQPTASQIALGTADGTIGLVLDMVAGTVTLSCAANGKPGQLTIKCGDGGTVNIQAGQGGNLTVDGGDSLTLKAASSISIQSDGNVTVKGSSISLN